MSKSKRQEIEDNFDERLTFAERYFTKLLRDLEKTKEDEKYLLDILRNRLRIITMKANNRFQAITSQVADCKKLEQQEKRSTRKLAKDILKTMYSQLSEQKRDEK